MKRILLLITALVAVWMGPAWAQSRTVTGKVVAKEDGAALPGVNVNVKGTTLGTATDAGGQYSITAEPGNTVVFSFIGLVSQEVVVGNQTVIDLKMAADVKQLGEVIVTAIGLKEDRDKFASSISTVQGTNVVRSGETSALTGLSR